MQVAKWGNSLAIRLPASIVELLDLKVGDNINVHVLGSAECALAREANRADIIERLRKFRGVLPPDFVFDRDEANAR